MATDFVAEGDIAGLCHEVALLRAAVEDRESPVLASAALVRLQAEVSELRDAVATLAVARRPREPVVASATAEQVRAVEARLADLGEHLADLAVEVAALRTALLGT